MSRPGCLRPAAGQPRTLRPGASRTGRAGGHLHRPGHERLRQGGHARCTLAVRGRHMQSATASGGFGRAACTGYLSRPTTTTNQSTTTDHATAADRATD
ncbi:hypothetical protein GTY23_40250 [Streptomyces sp. SID5998]|nr:hypothetical protein [Streptomyces sp. SID5998]